MPDHAARRFTATITATGTRAVIELPFDADEAWGAQDRHHLHGHIGGHWIRGVQLTRTALGYVISLGPAWRRHSGLAVGDTVDVVLEPEEPLIESLDDDIRSALLADSVAANTFRSAAPFYRKNFIRWITDAKRAETRAARIAETIELVAQGRIER